MFGFSIMKLLFTVAALVVIWQGFKWLNRRNELNRKRQEEISRGKPQAQHSADVEDMVECPNCGAYVPNDDRHSCG